MTELPMFDFIGTCISGVDVFIKLLTYLKDARSKDNKAKTDLERLTNEINFNIAILNETLSKQTITKKDFIQTVQSLSLKTWNQILFTGEGKKQRLFFQKNLKQENDKLIFQLMDNFRKKILKMKKQACDRNYLENFNRKKIRKRFFLLKENLETVNKLLRIIK